VVSGDTTPYAKPHPEPLFHASRLLELPPAACLFVGDAERDVAAGRAAGMRTLVALFGYIGSDEQPATWGADGLIDAPLETLEWLSETPPQTA
jgi:phosphoglycolate phosphatase